MWMFKKLFVCVSILVFTNHTYPQDSSLSRLIILESTLTIGAYAALSQVWYSDHEQTTFHFFNDGNAWLQQDKMGHAFTAFHLYRMQHKLLQQNGLSQKKSFWWSAASVSTFMLGIEVFDGFSRAWGASAYDVLANSAGIILAMKASEHIHFKFSYYPGVEQKHRPESLGRGISSVLKDYNAQTYWIGPRSKLLDSPVVPTIGYSARGMLGGHYNPERNREGVYLPDLQRKRMFILSIDLNPDYFSPQRKVWKIALKIAEYIKIPTPAIYLDGEQLKASWLYF